MCNPAAPDRRDFLLSVAAAALFPAPALAARGTTNVLRMLCPATGERFDATLIEDGSWSEDALRDLSRFARDWRADKAALLDREAVLALIRLQGLLDTSEPLHLLSGFRTRQTNQRLRGASRNSWHLKAAAFDLRQPGRSTGQLHAAALSLQAGGVGRYSRSGFVHIDSGPVRSWRGR